MLHFIALVLPSPLQEQVHALKLLMAERFHTRRALTAPAHITLFPPFDCKPEGLPDLRQLLSEFAAGRPAFGVELSDFAYFPPRVVYVDVRPSAALESLHADLLQALQPLGYRHPQEEGRPYRPHVTIGFRDLTEANFHAARAHLQAQHFRAGFQAASLCLLALRDGRWEVEGEFGFSL